VGKESSHTFSFCFASLECPSGVNWAKRTWNIYDRRIVACRYQWRLPVDPQLGSLLFATSVQIGEKSEIRTFPTKELVQITKFWRKIQ
jgi:hypothetical protein